MIHRWVAAFVSAAIPVAALCAPLVHAHLDDHDDDHHGASVVHAHVSGHHAGHNGPRRNHSDAARTFMVPEDRHEDDGAIWLQVYVAVAAASDDQPAAALTQIPLVAPPETVAHRPVDVVHGHDPPFRFRTPSRAPPSFLS